MSEATATIVLGKKEVLGCTECLGHFFAGTEMEVTASPEGWVAILCPDCVQKRDEAEFEGEEGPDEERPGRKVDEGSR